ncbi:MAG TPA: four-helix bundle copper-binding protein [Nevskiaceae bacterium]|nr:four-helix bundle copper-binding protein [Nevskiaceae bacterium]
MDHESCADVCFECHRACLSEAMTHCLTAGGDHVAPGHFRLMLDCAEICLATAHFMQRESPLHPEICGVCAAVCERCADSCDALDGMEGCAAVCRRCASHCREMGTAHAMPLGAGSPRAGILQTERPISP